MRVYTSVVLLLILSFTLCCKRDAEKVTADPSARLEFSSDTVFFDTLFSSVGSVTKRLKVSNPHKNAVLIKTIQLEGMNGSFFSIIINGRESYFEEEVKLMGGDSFYILVKALIDPQSQGTPYIITDKIIFNTNGNIQSIALVAWGQDAHFFYDAVVSCDTEWTNDKPYVVYNAVTVPVGCKLTIREGVRVHFHHKASMIVKGTLEIAGAQDEPVVFSGDKLGQKYAELPGQWGGIVFEPESSENKIYWTEIKNGENGIRMKAHTDADTIPELVIAYSVIRNMSGSGIEAVSTDLYGYNLLVNNCAGYTVAGLQEGNYHFYYCTFASYSYQFFRDYPVASFTGTSKVRMINSIIWGDRSNELQKPADFSADHSIIKHTSAITGSGNINLDPLFVSPVQKNFRLKENSPGIDAGTNIPSISNDIEGKPRGAFPDIGAYEKE